MNKYCSTCYYWERIPRTNYGVCYFPKYITSRDEIKPVYLAYIMNKEEGVEQHCECNLVTNQDFCCTSFEEF